MKAILLSTSVAVALIAIAAAYILPAVEHKELQPKYALSR